MHNARRLYSPSLHPGFREQYSGFGDNSIARLLKNSKLQRRVPETISDPSLPGRSVKTTLLKHRKKRCCVSLSTSVLICRPSSRACTCASATQRGCMEPVSGSGLPVRCSGPQQQRVFFPFSIAASHSYETPPIWLRVFAAT